MVGKTRSAMKADSSCMIARLMFVSGRSTCTAEGVGCALRTIRSRSSVLMVEMSPSQALGQDVTGTEQDLGEATGRRAHDHLAQDVIGRRRGREDRRTGRVGLALLTSGQTTRADHHLDDALVGDRRGAAGGCRVVLEDPD